MSESPPGGSRAGFAARFASRCQPVIRFGLVALAVWTVLRAVLIATFVEPGFRAAALRAMVAWGLPVDLLTAATMLLPGLLVVALFRAKWLFTVPARIVCAWLATSLLVFDAVVQFFFFEEYQARYNHLALDYIAYPDEVLGNIVASYDVRSVVILAIAAGGVLAVAQAWRARPIAPTWPFRDRLRAAACVVGLAAVLAVAWRLAPQPAVADRVATETARNGWPELARAYLTAHLDYDAYYLQVPDAEARTRLARLLSQPDPRRGLVRHFPSRRATGSRPLDVAIIMEESLGSEFSTRFGGSPGALTPELDRWSHEGISVIDLMATGNRTVRGLEGVLCSFPPLPGDAIVKGDASTGLATVPAVLHARGYRTVFLYGGRGIFDNLETFMLANGYEAFVSQADFPASDFRTVWGVADEYLLDALLDRQVQAQRRGQPFFATALTVSNHKPFRLPPGRIVNPEERSGRHRAVQYADWAIGRYLAAAKAAGVLEHTVVLIVGDHGARVYGAAEIPVGSYRIPAVILTPDAARRDSVIAGLASQIDLGPTVLSLAGIDYDAPFFGHDLLGQPATGGRAFVNHNRSIGLLTDDALAILQLHQAQRFYTRAGPGSDSLQPSQPSSHLRDLARDAAAVFQTAYHAYQAGAYRLPATP